MHTYATSMEILLCAHIMFCCCRSAWLAAAYAVLLFVSPAAAPIGVTLTVVGLVLVSTRYAWRAKFLALFNEA